MGDFLIGLLRKVFQQEENRLVGWLQDRKSVPTALLTAVAVIILRVTCPDVYGVVESAVVVTPTPLWCTLLLSVWLIALTRSLHRTRDIAERGEFIEDFRFGLERWEYRGGWRTEREGRGRILIVTRSGDGGIARPCRLWTDYMFEFETKIVKRNSSWIIRARDTLNYVMLQCESASLNPHYRVGGTWIKDNRIPLNPPLPLNTWFGVRIDVCGERVVVSVKGDNGRERELLNDTLLMPRVMRLSRSDDPLQGREYVLSYPTGSVGFREWQDKECAHFRNIRVCRR